MRKAALLTVGLVLVGSACAKSSASPFKACTARGFTSVGEKLPDCTFEGFNGSPTLRLAQLRGKPVVLNFWASWCIDCIREMPTFQKVFAGFGGRVAFVGMNVLDIQGETKGAGQTFAKRTGVQYMLAFDPEGLLYAHFSNRTLLPTTVFVDAKGVVKERHYGALDADDLRRAIRRYFNIT
jgi:thiol-disulfide isomerase/thioredoxin